MRGFSIFHCSLVKSILAEDLIFCFSTTKNSICTYHLWVFEIASRLFANELKEFFTMKFVYGGDNSDSVRVPTFETTLIFPRRTHVNLT
ncbi:Uncharacterized protein XB16_0971 [Leptospira santarosai]|uniref:Uncharacterized protein n=1 Tax=Leptospira santarosai TaxID=28183 RepID=A0A2P1QQY3_9LEPT|nr:Uncharacterized protein XB16_0971 [Leptospira santarosai]